MDAFVCLRATLLSTCLIVSLTVSGQDRIHDTAPKDVSIDRLSVTSLRLWLYAGSERISSATGFAVSKGDKHYLITNWHVLSGMNPETQQPIRPDGKIPDSITILHNVYADLGSWMLVRESLYNSDGDPLWIEHPEEDYKVDIVALPLTQLEGIRIISIDLSLASADIAVYPAESVSIIGFPYDMSSGAGFAIWKSGTIASDLDIDYIGRPIFLIDATTRQGMSGSPVISRRFGSAQLASSPSVATFYGTRDRFLGVYAGRIHEDAEVGYVWKASALLELIETLP